MDEMVRQAMAKWPNVPACYGWLGLDARGQWYMRDERTQAAGDFASGQPGAKGSLLQHEKLIEFIARNYLVDAQGRWYFQNGPQQVFVELEISPWIWRLQPDGRVLSHTGAVAAVRISYTHDTPALAFAPRSSLPPSGPSSDGRGDQLDRQRELRAAPAYGHSLASRAHRWSTVGGE
ncbi:MAG: DUF2946 family protein, partial [Hylemonella sp.]